MIKNNMGIIQVITLLSLLFCYTILDAQIPAFPGAEGHGKYVTGGRGGDVIQVTNLNDSGEGSLRAAVEASGPRTVVFRVSGTIQLQSRLSIRNDSITIAGQTAPGDGICLRDYPVTVDADNVIIRFIRFRMGDEAQQEADALGGRFRKNIIIDHCSMSWSTDECVSFYQNKTFTLQWCIISESLRNSVHFKGSHGYGGIWGGKNASFHHNLLAHHDSRNPRLGEYRGDEFALTDLVDLRNNVVYNWGGNSCYGGEAMNVNIVNCYYKPGPATSKVERIVAIDQLTEPGYPISFTWGKFYIDGNVLTESERATNDNWTYGVYNQFHGGYGTVSEADKEAMRLEEPHNPGEIQTDIPEVAYEKILEHAGASLVRDTVDKRIIHDVSTGTATYMDGGNGSVNGIIDTQEAVGGWPVLNSVPAPVDIDNDGMPDVWETANGLNPNDPDDRNADRNHDGYTNLEEYINSLVTVYSDVIPLLNVLSPQSKSGYLQEDTIFTEAYANDYSGGEIVNLGLYFDNNLIYETENGMIDTFLITTDIGPHVIKYTATDNSGNDISDSVRVFVGSEYYTLAVEQGTGEGTVILDPPGGNYVESTEVSLRAVPDFGYKFENWSSDEISSENPFNISMDMDKTITANFIPGNTGPVKINFQPDDSKIPVDYHIDSGEEYVLRENGYFYGWLNEKNSFAFESDRSKDPRLSTYIKMQEEGDRIWEFKLPDGNYAVYIGMGSPDQIDQLNSINIEGTDYTDAGYSNFDEYYIESVTVNDGKLTLTPTGDDAKINYIKIGMAGESFGRYLLVENGIGEGEYEIGSDVEIIADDAPPGYIFDRWTGDTGNIADVNSELTSLVMPETDISVVATYVEPVYSLTIINGSGSGTYDPGTLIYLQADDPTEGEEFSGWIQTAGPESDIGNADNPFAWVTMPEGNIEITATYINVTSVNHSKIGGGLRCYPNPASGGFTVELPGNSLLKIKIIDILGEIVYEKKVDEKVHAVEGQNLEKGIYFIRAEDSKGKIHSQKIVIR